jgi:hypothetical protein
VEQGKLKDPALQALVKELGAQNMGLCLHLVRHAALMDEVLGDPPKSIYEWLRAPAL